MPSGKVHLAATTGIALPFSVATSTLIALLVAPNYALLVAGVSLGGAISATVLTPDNDLVVLDAVEHRLLRETLGLWGLWIGAWYAYALYIPHRSLESHFPGYSTFLRLLYLHLWPGCGLFVWPLLVALYNMGVVTWIGWESVVIGYLTWFYTLTVADALHWFLDGCPVRPGDMGFWKRIGWEPGFVKEPCRGVRFRV